MTEPQYQTDLVAETGSVDTAVGMAHSYDGDLVEQARDGLDDADAVYHAVDETGPAGAERYWVEPESGLMTVQRTDGSVEEYFIIAADDETMAVADRDGCYKVGQGDDRFWVDGGDALSAELAADMYDIATAWDEYQQDQETETAALTIEGNDGHSEIYEQVQHQLEQDGEIVFDGTWSQMHTGNEGARGGAIGVQTKQMLDRKQKAGEIPYEVEGDSSGKHFTLRIQDFEEYDDL